MKIVTWNCNGALRNKTDELDSLGADIYVIQECENPAESTEKFQIWAGKNYLWTGESKHKGIGVFPKNGNIVHKLDWRGKFNITGLISNSPALNWTTDSLKLFLPFSINNDLSVLGVWTKSDKQNEIFGYIGQFWKYLQIHRNNLSSLKTIILGDFNSNSIWDKHDRWWNHSDVIKELRNIKIESIYHHQYHEDQGRESRPTFFLNRNTAKPYHIDYIFTTTDLLLSSQITLGKPESWLSLSDHIPLVLSISLHD